MHKTWDDNEKAVFCMFKTALKREKKPKKKDLSPLRTCMLGENISMKFKTITFKSAFVDKCSKKYLYI